ncbi:hypothetical protein D3C76_1555340 [compost metagenome]
MTLLMPSMIRFSGALTKLYKESNMPPKISLTPVHAFFQSPVKAPATKSMTPPSVFSSPLMIPPTLSMTVVTMFSMMLKPLVKPGASLSMT